MRAMQLAGFSKVLLGEPALRADLMKNPAERPLSLFLAAELLGRVISFSSCPVLLARDLSGL
jgi:hypothetical protein